MENKKNKPNSDTVVLLIILLVIGIFIFGLKPTYQFFQKLGTGTLFDGPVNTAPDQPSVPVKDDYTILKPIGASNTKCTLLHSTEKGDKETSLILYYTNKKLRSIVEEITYLGATDEYSNYILSEQSKYKERRNLNVGNVGYSVDYELINASELFVSSVYLLERTSLDEIKVSEGETLDLIGNYDDSVYDVMQKYISKGYKCNW